MKKMNNIKAKLKNGNKYKYVLIFGLLALILLSSSNNNVKGYDIIISNYLTELDDNDSDVIINFPSSTNNYIYDLDDSTNRKESNHQYTSTHFDIGSRYNPSTQYQASQVYYDKINEVNWNETETFNSNQTVFESNRDGNFNGSFDDNVSISGYYYSSPDSFNNEIIGTSGLDISWIDSYYIPNSCSVEIKDVVNEHNKTLELYHDGNGMNPSIQHNFDDSQISGTLEFYWGTSDNTKKQRILIYGNDGGIKLFIQAGFFQYESSGYQTTGVIPTNDILYHHKIIFDCQTDKFDWYINGILEINDGNFFDNEIELTRIHLSSMNNAIYSQYLDSVGYSWNDDYTVRDNINPYGLVSEIDWIDSSSIEYNCSVGIISEIDNHKEVLEFTDNSSIGRSIITHEFTKTVNSEFEFWFCKDSIVASSIYIEFYEDSQYIDFLEFKNDDLSYYDSGFHTTIKNDFALVEIFNHYKIIFDDSNNNFDLYIDGILEGNDLSVSNNINLGINKIRISTDFTETYFKGYFDALGSNSDSEYIIGNNLNDSIENNIKYAFIDYDFNPIEYRLLNLDYTSNITNLDQLYLYNYIDTSYELIHNYSGNSFDDSYVIDSDYVNNNKVLLKIILNQTITQLLTFSKLSLSLKDIDYLNTTNQKIVYTHYCYNKNNPSTWNDGLKYRITTTILFNKTEFIDFKQTKANYIYPSGFLSSATIFEYDSIIQENDIENIEIDFHAYLGNNPKNPTETGFNSRIQFIINQNSSLIFNYDSFKSETSSYEASYLRLESFKDYISIYYSAEQKEYIRDNLYPSISKLRFLETVSNGFVIIPYITELQTIKQHPTPIPDEPDEPDDMNEPTDNYWVYSERSMEYYYDDSNTFYENVDFYNESVEASYDYDWYNVRGKSVPTKFYYDDNPFDKADFGNWKFTFITVEVNFNILRDVLVMVANGMSLIWYFAGYCFMICWNDGIMFLFCYHILPFFWNTLIHASYYIVISLLFWMYVGLILVLGWLWFFIKWIYELVFLPFLEWLIETGLPSMIEFLVVLFAFILALIIWFGTLCQADFDSIYEQTYELVRLVADFLIDTITILIENFTAIIVSVLLYIILIGLAFIKEVYAKAKGYPNRSLQLHESIEAYMIPFRIGFNLIVNTKEMFARWS